MLVALFAMQVMSVSAASKTTGMALTGSASPAYELREMNDSILAGIGNEDVAQLIRDINAGKKTAPDIAAQLEGKTLITPIMDLLPINGGIKSADGKQYIVQKISVSTLAKGMTDIQVLHYSIANQKWEIITPDSVDLNSKEIEVKFNDLSPVAVIANVDAAQAVNNTAGTSPKKQYMGWIRCGSHCTSWCSRYRSTQKKCIINSYKRREVAIEQKLYYAYKRLPFVGKKE